MLRAIYKRRHLEYRFSAALHGITLPEHAPGSEKFHSPTLSLDEEKAIERALALKAENLKKAKEGTHG